MGSSAKKKAEKKKDFQKPKLKVGKAKPKASNFTDTSFKAKSIVVNKQSISVDAPSASAQFSHHVALLKNRSDSQRSESLAFLAGAIAQAKTDDALPEPVSTLLPKLVPLILDGSNAVRQQSLKTLHVLGSRNTEIRMHAEVILLYVHAGMSHLSADIRTFSVAVLDWLLDVAGADAVTCAGGWTKTLECFMSLLGWSHMSTGTRVTGAQSGWTAAQKPAFRPGGEASSASKVLRTLHKFLLAGLKPPDLHQGTIEKAWGGLLWHVEHHSLPASRNAFSYLGLFNRAPEDDEARVEDREDRQQVLAARYKQSIDNGVDMLVKEGGELGRAAAVVKKTLLDGLRDFEEGLQHEAS